MPRRARWRRRRQTKSSHGFVARRRSTITPTGMRSWRASCRASSAALLSLRLSFTGRRIYARRRSASAKSSGLFALKNGSTGSAARKPPGQACSARSSDRPCGCLPRPARGAARGQVDAPSPNTGCAWPSDAAQARSAPSLSTAARQPRVQIARQERRIPGEAGDPAALRRVARRPFEAGEHARERPGEALDDIAATGRSNAAKRAGSPLAFSTSGPTCGRTRSMMWARIGRPPIGRRHLSPPPMRRDRPPARITPATSRVTGCPSPSWRRISCSAAHRPARADRNRVAKSHAACLRPHCQSGGHCRFHRRRSLQPDGSGLRTADGQHGSDGRDERPQLRPGDRAREDRRYASNGATSPPSRTASTPTRARFPDDVSIPAGAAPFDSGRIASGGDLSPPVHHARHVQIRLPAACRPRHERNGDRRPR